MANRQFVSFPFSDLYKIKQQVLDWSARFNTFSFLDNQQYVSGENPFEFLVAAGEKSSLKAASGKAFIQLREFSTEHHDWLFGHFSFDLKAETEGILSGLADPIQFPDLHFFVPEIVLLISQKEISMGLFGDHHENIWNEILTYSPPALISEKIPPPKIEFRISREDYISAVKKIQRHIHRGDCYEINFCQEFFVREIEPDLTQMYRSLNRLSPSPFSAFYKYGDQFLLCASPERYLKRSGDQILSQPIKGTAARDLLSPEHDEQLKIGLAQSEKDRTENVMIVDLVRNDLSKICETNSVRVTELFGIYSFAQVHQMISTIVGKPLHNLHWTEMIQKTFPMGSMTGAPKKRVLELIEKYETTKRGLFSGALGYVKPNFDFDFNVVIRSILYNRATKHLSYFAGSGITINSDPESEYEECLLKVAAFEEVIKKPITQKA